MSDIVQTRTFVGNLPDSVGHTERGGLPVGTKKPLVEESEIVWISALQKMVGKKPLLAAARDARPFRLPVPSGYYDVWLTYETHRLPGRLARWSSVEEGTARLWLVCLGCRRKVAKLHYFFLAGSLAQFDLLCRTCHRLPYQSTNCGGNRWYKEVARPLKRLLNRKERLMARRDSPRVRAELEQIEGEIKVLKAQVRPKTRRQRWGQGTRQPLRRPYRNLTLLDR